MTFYLLVPMIWSICAGGKRIAFFAFMIPVALFLTAGGSLLVEGTARVKNDTFFYYWFPTQFPVFVGGLVFYFAAMKKQIDQPWWLFFGFVPLFILGLALGPNRMIPMLAPSVVGLSFILLAGYFKQSGTNILASKPFIVLGRLSYSLYIFHFAILDAIRHGIAAWHIGGSPVLLFVGSFVLTLLGTGVIAVFSKRVIEDPGIRFGHRLSARIVTRQVV